MRIQFTKMSGAGNDFIVVDNRSRKIVDGPRTARSLCDRRWGIGADGLLLLEKSRRAHYRMMYYNADGSYGGMCGNGGRCMALYAVERAIAPRLHSLEALDHVYTARVDKRSVTLWMKPPKGLVKRLVLRIAGEKRIMSSVDTGSPHVVIRVGRSMGSFRDLHHLDVSSIGKQIRHHVWFGRGGTNVNFVYLRGDKSLEMRTYERGVEAETLACGTGAIACAVVANSLWRAKPPVEVMTRSGRILMVNFMVQGGQIRDVTLTGPAEVIFQGILDARKLSQRARGR